MRDTESERDRESERRERDKALAADQVQMCLSSVLRLRRLEVASQSHRNTVPPDEAEAGLRSLSPAPRIPIGLLLCITHAHTHTHTHKNYTNMH